MKNCGSVVHNEVASRAMMDDFRQLVNVCFRKIKANFISFLIKSIFYILTLIEVAMRPTLLFYSV